MAFKIDFRGKGKGLSKDPIAPSPPLTQTPLANPQALSQATGQTTSTPSIASLRVEWHETADYYNTSQLARVWRGGVHANAQVSPGSGYLGGGALTGGSANNYVWHPIYGQTDFYDFGMGARIRIAAAPGAENILLAAVDSAGTVQVCLTLRTDLKLSIWRGNLSSLLGTSLTAVALNTHLRVGFRGRVDTPGFAEGYIDANVLVRVEGDTKPNATNWRGPYIGLAPGLFVSHMYAGSGSGALIPGYLVRTSYPSAGGTNEWTAVGAVTVTQAIDELIANDDTDYAQSPGLGSKFTEEHSDVPTDTVRIYGTRSVAIVRNIPDSGFSPSYAPVLRNPDGDRNTAPWRAVTTDEWRGIDRFDRVNPWTGLPWTVAERNGSYSWGGETQP